VSAAAPSGGSAGKRRRSSRNSANPRTAPEEIADAIDEVIEETRQAANELVDLERSASLAKSSLDGASSPPQAASRRLTATGPALPDWREP
jgi:hypothetical protein